jgi:hypothetical protein
VLRPVDQDVFDEVQLQMNEPKFRQKISERMWKMEGLWAEAKQNHCLARAKYRGRAKVQIQAYLCAIVQNLKRLLFPLYCWLLAHHWSYSTNNPRALISNQSRQQTSAKPKPNCTFSTGPTDFDTRLMRHEMYADKRRLAAFLAKNPRRLRHLTNDLTK